MSPATVEPFGLVQQALEIYRKHFGVLFPLALICGLLQAIITQAFGPAELGESNTSAMIGTFVGLLPVLVFLAFTVELLRDLRARRDVRSTGELVVQVLPVILPLLSLVLLAAIPTVLGLILLIVPGLILATIWAVIVPVFVIERPPLLASFGRSRALVRGYGWPVLGTILLTLLIALLAAIVGAILAIDPTSPIGSVVQLVIVSLVTPVTTLMLGGLYFRLVDLHGPPAAEPLGDPAHEAFGRRD